MTIDILFAITMLLAIFKGWTKGLIVGIFSLLALILGAAAALKLSGSFALYMESESGHSSPLWPVVAFVLIFLVVALIVRLIARLIEKALQLVMMGWLNRIAGILLYGFTYAVLFSIALWFANQLYLIEPTMKASSRTYSWIAPLGPEVIAVSGQMIPWLRDIFHQLEQFFQSISPLPA
ncbi:MAG TPA: CvpA family protein [Chitinophagaceae bacterium]|jgi:membrane protein required for colicin V production|nr:CvpA family protein [Chitinophagaceae bacterium]